VSSLCLCFRRYMRELWVLVDVLVSVTPLDHTDRAASREALQLIEDSAPPLFPAGRRVAAALGEPLRQLLDSAAHEASVRHDDAGGGGAADADRSDWGEPASGVIGGYQIVSADGSQSLDAHADDDGADAPADLAAGRHCGSERGWVAAVADVTTPLRRQRRDASLVHGGPRLTPAVELLRREQEHQYRVGALARLLHTSR
jgi:hypothetical protein